MSNSDLTYNPFDTTSSIDKIGEAREKRERQQALLAEEVREYRLVLNRLFASPDGQFFLKKLIKYCGVNSFDNSINPTKDVKDAERRKVYLELIRPYLDKTILMEIIE